jgi:hypothetical protein
LTVCTVFFVHGGIETRSCLTRSESRKVRTNINNDIVGRHVHLISFFNTDATSTASRSSPILLPVIPPHRRHRPRPTRCRCCRPAAAATAGLTALACPAPVLEYVHQFSQGRLGRNHLRRCHEEGRRAGLQAGRQLLCVCLCRGAEGWYCGGGCGWGEGAEQAPCGRSQEHENEQGPPSYLEEGDRVALLEHVHHLRREAHRVFDRRLHDLPVFLGGDQPLVGLEQPAVDAVKAVRLTAVVVW